MIVGLIGLAGVACAVDDNVRATRLLGAADANTKIIGLSLYPAAQRLHDRVMATVQAATDVGEFEKAYADGDAMAVEQAIEYALAETPLGKRSVAQQSMKHRSGGPLAPREREVAILVAQGLSNRDIAARLVISERTAETHVQHILNKLGCNSRAQVATWATQHGLVPKLLS